MDINTDNRIARIAQYYGDKRQREKTIEEMAELMVEIKHLDKADDCCAYIEELVDTKIMIDQLLWLATRDTFGAKLVHDQYEFKVSREIRRMEGKE